jgi:hypothetical protein
MNRSIWLALVAVLVALLAVAAAAHAAAGDIWVTSIGYDSVTCVSPQTGAQRVVSTNSAPTGEPTFGQPYDAAFAPNGDLYVIDIQAFADFHGGIIRVNKQTGARAPVSSNAISLAAGGAGGFVTPTGIKVAANGDIYVTDIDGAGSSGATGGIIKVDPATGKQTVISNNTISSAQAGGEAVFLNPYDFVLAPGGGFYIADDTAGSANPGRVIAVSATGKETTLSSNAKSAAAGGESSFKRGPAGIALGPSGEVYVADYDAKKIIQVNPANGAQTTRSSGGSFVIPFDVEQGPSGLLYVMDYGAGDGGTLFSVNPANGSQTVVSTNAVSDAAGGAQGFATSTGIAVEPAAGAQVACSAAAPPPPPQCSDGIDNDGDGKVDYPADAGCSSAADATESPDPAVAAGAAAAPPQCADHKDNDADGATDTQDPGCSSPADTNEADESIQDLVLCGRRQISLVRADAKGSKVVLSGLVSQANAGKPIEVFANYAVGKKARAGRFTRLGTVKATKTGEFTARVKRPPARLFAKARFVAQVGKARSVALKLPQSLASSSVKKAGQQIELHGTVKRSLLGKRNPIVVRRIVCGRYQTVGSAKPSKSGRYTVRFPAPALGAAALYRAESRVLAKPGSKRYVKQFARAIGIALTGQTG